MNNSDCKDGDSERALIDVEKAGEDLRLAMGALQTAEKNLECAEHELMEAREQPHAFKVMVIYNGLEREIEAKADELVSTLLARAIAAFGALSNPHTLSLWTKGGEELPDGKTLRDAGVKPCETVLLRPGAVKGGAR